MNFLTFLLAGPCLQDWWKRFQKVTISFLIELCYVLIKHSLLQASFSTLISLLDTVVRPYKNKILLMTIKDFLLAEVHPYSRPETLQKYIWDWIWEAIFYKRNYYVSSWPTLMDQRPLLNIFLGPFHLSIFGGEQIQISCDPNSYVSFKICFSSLWDSL